MANDVTITNLTAINGQISSAVTSINSNFANIQTALLNTLALDGTSPNQMEANLDMNSFRILNLPQPMEATDPVRLIDIGASANYILNTGITSVVNNAALNALSTATNTYVLRLGYLIPGDCPPVIMKAGPVPTLNSGAGDGCSQVPSSDGKGWYAQFQFCPYVTPQMWGAKGDGVADDTIPVTSALTIGLAIVLRGIYNVSSLINISCPIGKTVIGYGAASRINLTTTTAALIFTIGNYPVTTPASLAGHPPTITLSNFKLIGATQGAASSRVSGVSTGFALSIIGGINESESLIACCNIDHVDIMPLNTGCAIYNGLLIQDAGYSSVTECAITGWVPAGQSSWVAVGATQAGHTGTIGSSKTTSPYVFDVAGVGIKIACTIYGAAAPSFKIDNCTVWWWYRGIYFAPSGFSGALSPPASSDPQGLWVRGCDIGICQFGVVAESSDGIMDSVIISDCTINFQQYGVYVKNARRPNVHDNYFLSGTQPDGLTASSIGIHCEYATAQWANIHDNFITYEDSTSFYTSKIGIQVAWNGSGSGTTVPKVANNVVYLGDISITAAGGGNSTGTPVSSFDGVSYNNYTYSAP